ncbi:MAG TPA: glycosyltransferase family 2 protein [Saprospiraceae bacterium]|nr:glycosyltransferase family 2 protein [Saprospiraceae bacterium]
MTEKHTFIIPAFGNSPYLEECIQSLLNQSVKSTILITTSTPSEFILEIAQKHHLTLQINPIGNNGIAEDWNFAIAQANTPFVTLAHQDEIFQPDYTESIMRRIELNTNKRIIILFTNYQEMIGKNFRSQVTFHAIVKKLLLSPFLLMPNISSKIIKKAILSLGTPICCSSVTFHKDLILDFTFSKQYRVALDWYAWLQLSEKSGYFCYLNKKLISHRIHSGTETYQQIQSGMRYKEELAIFTSIWGKTIAKFLMKFYIHGHTIHTKVE